MSAIKLSDVTFSYDGENNIFQNAEFCADYGQVVLVCGQSGTGKSTLMAIISGIIPNIEYGKLQGVVELDGESIVGKKSAEICRKVGVVLQNADEQIVHKIVEDEIAFGCENIAMDSHKIDNRIGIVCSLMGLERSWYCRKLSGGQKQRLITASTLAMGQKIVVLDEPLANLDSKTAEHMMQTLRDLARSGYCIVVVEHRIDKVLPYVDKVCEVANGKIVELDDAKLYLKSQSGIILDSAKNISFGQQLFDVKNVTFRLGKKLIFDNINCVINQGERVVLLGENGCGKTTFLRLLAKLYKPTKGKIKQQICDGYLGIAKRKWYRKVGVVYQNPDYQLFMPTVLREIEFGAKSKEYAQQVVKMFKLQDILHRHPQSLSQGQKRRVSIAAVVATEPSVMLLDEPTVGQDYQRLTELVDILNKLNRKHSVTLITVTHDVRCAEALCDKAILIENGKVAEIGDKAMVGQYFGTE